MTKTKTIPLEVPEEWDVVCGKCVDCDIIANNGPYRMVYASLKSETKPSWSWCESPTDEMALLRPDCEVRPVETKDWKPGGRLLGVREYGPFAKFSSDCGGTAFCRVRLDRDGNVIVRWGDGQLIESEREQGTD